VIDYDAYLDELDYFEERSARQTVRKAGRKPKQLPAEHIAQLTDAVGIEAGFNPTYQPARFEEGWLLDSVRSFYEDQLITDVLARVKGGKEANVYRCAAEPSTGATLLAAKVYRPRQFRNLRNDKLYRDGRQILTETGRAVKETDHRLMRAIGKKTATGVEVAHTSWLMHEYTTLQRLHELGAAVPQPVAVNGNALLMSYCGDAQNAAPTLNGVRLDRDEANWLFNEVVRNMGVMLAQGLIHGDLSAYNILYWDHAITIIDFPQVTYAKSNRHAYDILRRDVTRVCEYFAAQSVRCSPAAITNELWDRYAALDPDDVAADASVEG